MRECKDTRKSYLPKLQIKKKQNYDTFLSVLLVFLPSSKISEMALGRRKGKREKVNLTKASYEQAKNFLSFLKPYSGIYFIGFIFLFLSSAVSISLPYFLGEILGVDRKDIPEEWTVGDMDNIYGILIIIAIILPLQAVFSFFRIYIFSYVTQNTLKDIRQKAFEKLITAPLSYFDSSKTGETVSKIANDTEQIQEVLTTTLAEFIRQTLVVVVGIAFIFTLSWKLSLIMLAVIPIAAITAMIFGKFIKKLSKETQDKTAKSNHILEEALVGIKSLKAYTSEFTELKKYSNAVGSVKELALKTALWRGLFVGFILTIMLGAIVFIIWMGIELIEDKTEFFKFILYTVMLGTSIGSLPDQYAKIQKAIGATESVMDIIQHDTEEIDLSKPTATQKIFEGNIDLKDISFSYPSRKEIKIIQHLSLSIKAGEQIALVGSSGSGKSTIASLLLHFYKLDGGTIEFDGKPSTDFAVNELRSQMAFVPQEVILLGGTIEENIKYGKPNASNEEVRAAAEKANALTFIEEFPDKFDTIVGDRGIQLSGGQRQRIAIARAILKDPVVLIMDEATSALDTESEHAVQDALNKLMKNRTSLIIAHRLSTIKNANSIIVLDKGRIVEEGTHEELLEKVDGAYKKLNNLQFT
jgi:ABC-type multidrug transport system fused ATPase/permease subunit|tara:strand:- start:1499 stop:3418 length:1920 start_codon:yes stop_codon:yes gene_type:complete